MIKLRIERRPHRCRAVREKRGPRSVGGRCVLAAGHNLDHAIDSTGRWMTWSTDWTSAPWKKPPSPPGPGSIARVEGGRLPPELIE